MKKLILTSITLISLLTSCNKPSESLGFIQGNMPPGTNYKVGDTMYDYNATDLEGNSHIFSKVLQEKELLILNFFFTTCAPCQVEFPYLQQVYEQVKDRVEVIAVNPTGESKETVTNFITDREYTFPVTCESKTYLLRSAFTVDLRGYPTSVVIGKKGVILDIHTGTLNTYDLMYSFITEYLSE